MSKNDSYRPRILATGLTVMLIATPVAGQVADGAISHLPFREQFAASFTPETLPSATDGESIKLPQ